MAPHEIIMLLLVAASVIFWPLTWFVQGLSGFAVVPPLIFILVFIAIFLQAVFPFGKGRNEAMMEGWNRLKECMEINEKFGMIKGEKTVFPLTPCIIVERASFSYKSFPRDVIITNRRIVLGFYLSLLFFKQKETFGTMNIWYIKPKSVPLGEGLGALSGMGERTVKKISSAKDDYGPFITVDLETMPASSFKIYHPNAKEICALFSDTPGR